MMHVPSLVGCLVSNTTMDEIKSLIGVAKTTVDTAKNIANTAGSVFKSLKPSSKSSAPAHPPPRSLRPRSGKGKKLGSQIMSQWRTKNPLKKVADTNIIDGTDLLMSISSPTETLKAGDILYSLPINPNTLPISRVSRMAKLYTKFKFIKFEVTYSPAADMTKAGQLIGYFDYNVKSYTNMVDGIQNLQKAAAYSTEKPTKIHEQKSWVLHNDSEVPLYTDIKVSTNASDITMTDPKWNCQGRFYILAASDIEQETPLGVLYCRYKVEFSMPQVDYESLDAGATYIAHGSTTCSTSQPLGVPSEIKVYDISTFSPDITDLEPNRWVMGPGTFFVQYYGAGSGDFTSAMILPADAQEVEDLYFTVIDDTGHQCAAASVITSTTKWYFRIYIEGGGTIANGQLLISCIPDPITSTAWSNYYRPSGKLVIPRFNFRTKCQRKETKVRPFTYVDVQGHKFCRKPMAEVSFAQPIEKYIMVNTDDRKEEKKDIPVLVAAKRK